MEYSWQILKHTFKIVDKNWFKFEHVYEFIFSVIVASPETVI